MSGPKSYDEFPLGHCLQLVKAPPPDPAPISILLPGFPFSDSFPYSGSTMPIAPAFGEYPVFGAGSGHELVVAGQPDSPLMTDNATPAFLRPVWLRDIIVVAPS